VLTQGDPAGIGPELALALWRDRAVRDTPPFALIGSAGLMRARAQSIGLAASVVTVASTWDAAGAFATALPVIDIAGDGPSEAAWATAGCEPGRPDSATAPLTLLSIARAVALVTAGEAGAVITNPIAKSVLYAAGFRHPGHTEYLAALAARPGEAAPRPVMLIWSEALAIVPVTIHIPLSSVPAALTTDAIVETGLIVAQAWERLFRVPRPRLAIAGLNPHAGEGGALGAEDDAIVRPAVDALQARGIAARGPLPADTMFHARARATYDVALTMYHDQGLIPAKTLAFDEGVNVTLGLPFIRTSPDHGTAFDIAGRGVARPDSLLEALRLARRLADQNADGV
jgi:4-hydroxythreonine-4-phosphate dehydrogenase